MFSAVREELALGISSDDPKSDTSRGGIAVIGEREEGEDEASLVR